MTMVGEVGFEPTTGRLSGATEYKSSDIAITAYEIVLVTNDLPYNTRY
jgi:hypothetical protein